MISNHSGSDSLIQSLFNRNNNKSISILKIPWKFLNIRDAIID